MVDCCLFRWYHALAFLLLAFCVTSFHVPTSTTIAPKASRQPLSGGWATTVLQLSSQNDEDWYSDYSPQAYVYKEDDDNSDRDDRGGGNNDRGSRYVGQSDRYGGSDRGRGGGRGGGGSRGGSGGGGRFGASSGRYERDTSMDNSNVDVTAVELLIDRRTAARRANDFDAADDIRNQLLNTYGVQIWDRDKVWRTGCSASGSGQRRSSSDRGGDRGNDRGGDRRGGGDRREFGGRGGSFNNRNDRDGGRRARPPKDFGPTGHDYSMSPDAGPINVDLSQAEIDELIAARLQAKMSRNFDQADRIQSELTNVGVYVHDGMKEWRADGIMFGDYANGDRPGRERASRKSQRDEAFAQSPYSTGIDSLTMDDVAKIEGMVSRRAGAKLSRNYRTADGIRDELKEMYNVFVDDRLKQWSVGGDFGPDAPGNLDKRRPWTMSMHSQSLTDETILPDIVAELERRDEAKIARNFDLADDIRKLLQDDFNVAVDDRLREWSVGGEFGLKRVDGPFVRRGGGDLTPDEEAEIADLVEVRARAKKDRDFDRADELRDVLEARYAVKVDDKSREWRVMSDDYVLSRVNGRLADTLDDETIGYIQNRLKERSAFKSDRNYEAADDVRDELKAKYGVSIDDRTREWSVEVDQFSVVDSTRRSGAAASATADWSVAQSVDSRVSGYDDDYDDEDEGVDDNDTDFGFLDAPNGSLDANETPENVATTENADSLASFTVPELKEKLKAAGLPVSGRKSELIERLLAAQ